MTDTQTISWPEISPTIENLKTLFDSMGGSKTRPFKLRTTIKSLQKATLFHRLEEIKLRFMNYKLS